MSTADRPLPDHRDHDGRHDPHDHRPHDAHDHSAGASRGRLALVLALTSTVLVAEVVTAGHARLEFDMSRSEALEVQRHSAPSPVVGWSLLRMSGPGG